MHSKARCGESQQYCIVSVISHPVQSMLAIHESHSI